MIAMVAAELPPDERELIKLVQEIKRSGNGYGEFGGKIVQREITLVNQTMTHKIA